MAGPYDDITNDLGSFLRAKQSPLAPYAGAFVQAGRKYGVDPKLLVSIAGAESSFGKQNSGQFNPFGYGPGRDFPSYGAAVDTVASDLSRNYIGQGLTTIPQIASRYAPVGAGNDPTNLNSNWTRNVSSILAALGGLSPAAAGAPPTAPAPTAPAPAPLRLPAAPPPTASDPGLGAQVPPGALPPGLVAAFAATNRMLGLPKFTPPRFNIPAAIPAAVPAAQPSRPASAAPPKSKRAPLEVEVTHTEPVTPLAATVVKLAQQYKGTPYVWGGASPKGWDCSGFVQWIYAHEGVKLPRRTYEQVSAGVAVDRADLQPGDIVFFDTESTSGPDHEGLYIGDGQFIHSPHTGDVVKISSLNEPYYKTHYAAGRRVA